MIIYSVHRDWAAAAFFLENEFWSDILLQENVLKFFLFIFILIGIEPLVYYAGIEPTTLVW